MFATGHFTCQSWFSLSPNLCSIPYIMQVLSNELAFQIQPLVFKFNNGWKTN